jgi:hypothetical protein
LAFEVAAVLGFEEEVVFFATDALALDAGFA